jgi:leucyl-tRNA synthetase
VFVSRESGERLDAQVEKMSKSKLNVVNPDDVIDRYGADAMRLYEMFMGPLEVQKPWQMKDVEGVARFLQRVWRLVVDDSTGERSAKIADVPGDDEPELFKTLHRTIKKVTADTAALSMNTAIAQMMIFVNEATAAPRVPLETVTAFLRVLSAYAPHVAEELWERLDQDGLVAHADWPPHDETWCIDDTVTVVVQVNGKKRDEILAPRGASNEELERLALACDGAARHLAGASPRKVIVVPGRLVNIVA